ncbi:MAG: hypothetical protein V8T86_06140 [Victivallis sp.]
MPAATGAAAITNSSPNSSARGPTARTPPRSGPRRKNCARLLRSGENRDEVPGARRTGSAPRQRAPHRAGGPGAVQPKRRRRIPTGPERKFRKSAAGRRRRTGSGFSAPRLIPRFAALARGRRSGFIPYFADNRFAPLVWAESANPPGRLVGFELESVVLWSRLIPLFPQHLPPYFRIELVDASNRVIHAAGGDISGKETAEPVLIMPFSELLLPNARIRPPR